MEDHANFLLEKLEAIYQRVIKSSAPKLFFTWINETMVRHGKMLNNDKYTKYDN